MDGGGDDAIAMTSALTTALSSNLQVEIDRLTKDQESLTIVLTAVESSRRTGTAVPWATLGDAFDEARTHTKSNAAAFGTLMRSVCQAHAYFSNLVHICDTVGDDQIYIDTFLVLPKLLNLSCQVRILLLQDRAEYVEFEGWKQANDAAREFGRILDEAPYTGNDVATDSPVGQLFKVL